MLFASRLVIAAPSGVVKKLQSILDTAGIGADAVCFSGQEALEILQGEEALLLTTVKLDDMTGAELARQAGDTVDVLMIVPGDYDEAAADNVLLLRNPLSPDALVQAVRTMVFCSERMIALRAKVEKLERTLEDRKVIERAKGRLMDALKLSESEAHHCMQKKSMDSGRRIADVAREILEMKDVSAF